MVTRRPKRKRGAGLHRQGKHHGGSIRAVHCLYGWGKWSKASRAADCHFGRARFGFVRREFYVQSQATKCFSTCLLLLATLLRYLYVGYRRYEYQA
eukprot:scaffold45905_cov51-Attheya_sp.AAC.2